MMGACARYGRSRQVPVSSSSTSPSRRCGDKDVKIRVLRAGLCGTDLHLEQWDEWAAATVQVPMTLGHEFFGEVVEVGADVDHVSVGDRVSGEGHIVCGNCRNCRAGRRHLCINIGLLKIKSSKGSASVHTHYSLGGEFRLMKTDF